MKRILSFMLIMTITLSSILSLGGCSSKKQSTLSLGEWLVMLNSSFGMDSYNSDTSYFDNVSESNIYFDVVQIAVEWDVIDTTQKIDVNKALTWCDALMTLVNASVFRAYTMTSEEKLDYALANFDCKIDKKKVNNIIEPYDAVALLTQVQQKWTNRTYDTPIEEVKFADSVKELTDVTDYKIENNTVVLRKEKAGDIAAGDVYVINGEDGLQAFKAAQVTEQDGNIYIENSDEDLFITDVVENMLVQETIIPDESNMALYDVYGNRIGGNELSALDYKASDTGARLASAMGNVGTINALSLPRDTTKFQYDDYEIELGYKFDDGLNVSAKISDKSTNFTYSFDISDIKATPEVDISFFKIKSASLKLDYKTNSTFTVDPPSTDIVDLVAAPYNNGNGKGLTNILKSTVKKSSSKGAKTIKIGSLQLNGADPVRVCIDISIKVSVDGKLTLVLSTVNTKGVEYKNGNIRFINEETRDRNISVEAKIESTMSVGMGLYCVGLKKRLIGADIIFGVGAKASGKVNLVDPENHLIEMVKDDEYTTNADAALLQKVITTTTEIISDIAKSQGGSYTAGDNEVQLHLEMCADIIGYGILKIELGNDSQICKLFGISGKSYTFLEENNATFYHAHIEDFKFAEGFANAVWGSDARKLDLCTKKFKPFDEADEEESETAEDESIQSDDGTIIEGKYISLSQLGVSLSQGEQYTVGIETLPEGYSIADVKYSVQDTSVATVNSNGLVTAIAEGSTMLVVYIEGTEYKAYQAIMIINPDTVTMSPLM